MSPASRKDHRDPEDHGEVQDYPDDRGRDSREGGPEASVASEALDVGRAQEDVEEAGEERHPRRDGGTDRGGAEPGHPLRAIPRRYEPDELENHDQRSGRRLGETQAVDRL